MPRINWWDVLAGAVALSYAFPSPGHSYFFGAFGTKQERPRLHTFFRLLFFVIALAWFVIAFTTSR